MVNGAQIDLDINLVERKTGGLGAGGGLATGGGLGVVGSFSYSEKNLFGLNQKLTAQVELGQVWLYSVVECSGVLDAELVERGMSYLVHQTHCPFGFAFGRWMSFADPTVFELMRHPSWALVHAPRWTRCSGLFTQTPGCVATSTAPAAPSRS